MPILVTLIILILIFFLVTGPRRVNVKMKKGGKEMLEHMKSILEGADLKSTEGAKDLDERGLCMSTLISIFYILFVIISIFHISLSSV